MSAVLVILVLLLSPIAAAQASAQAGPGCGPANVEFDVKTTLGQHATPAIQPGKALVFFLQDDLKYRSIPRPTTQFGIDGTWLGATHADSYFYVFVEPGEHHVCANWQSPVDDVSIVRPTAATHFTAEAGKSYYFRAQDISFRARHTSIVEAHGAELILAPLDSDEAQVLMNSFSLSSSHQKK